MIFPGISYKKETWFNMYVTVIDSEVNWVMFFLNMMLEWWLSLLCYFSAIKNRRIEKKKGNPGEVGPEIFFFDFYKKKYFLG
jgi:hypothetical protein